MRLSVVSFTVMYRPLSLPLVSRAFRPTYLSKFFWNSSLDIGSGSGPSQMPFLMNERNMSGSNLRDMAPLTPVLCAV